MAFDSSKDASRRPLYWQERGANKSCGGRGHQPFLLPSLHRPPAPSCPLSPLLFLPFPALYSLPLPLEVGLLNPYWIWERFSSPSGSWQSPATKRYLVYFKLKIQPPVAENETSNWGWPTVNGKVCAQIVVFDSSKDASRRPLY